MLRHALVLAALAAALAVAVQGRKLSQEGELLQAMTGALAPAAPLLDAPGPAPALPPAMADGGMDMPAVMAAEGEAAAEAAGVKAYTLAEVAENNSEASAWIAVDGKVYDVTEWAPKHPGGAAKIYKIAGTDATAVFTRQHGIPSSQFQILQEYYIGDLA